MVQKEIMQFAQQLTNTRYTSMPWDSHNSRRRNSVLLLFFSTQYLTYAQFLGELFCHWLCRRHFGRNACLQSLYRRQTTRTCPQSKSSLSPFFMKPRHREVCPYSAMVLVGRCTDLKDVESSNSLHFFKVADWAMYWWHMINLLGCHIWLCNLGEPLTDWFQPLFSLQSHCNVCCLPGIDEFSEPGVKGSAK